MENETMYNSNYFDIQYIYYKINFYSMVTLIPIGIIGNLISLFIFTRPSFNQKTNTGLLYTLFCVVNLITIVYEASFRNADDFIEFSIKLPLSIQIFFERVLLQCLSWIQVIISLDRFIFVLYPVKGFQIMSKKSVLYSIILGLLIIIIGLNSLYFVRGPFTFTIGFNQTVTCNYCISQEIAVLTLNIQVFVQFFIPFLIMVIVDSMVIIRFKKSRTQLNERKNSHTAKKSSRFTRNTILIDLIYMIFNFPSILYGIYMMLVFVFPNSISLSLPYHDLFEIIFPLFSFFYLCLIFLLFISFNRIFRSELIKIFNLQKFFSTVNSSKQ